MSYLTTSAKAQLSKTIRNLRDRLLNDLHNAVESAYLMGAKLDRVTLDEERRRNRQRLEDWLAMQVKGELTLKKGRVSEKQRQEMSDRHRCALEKLAAATWLNRLAVIKHLEAMDLIKPKVLTGGWQSQAYKEFREFAPELLQDETEGFGLLLRLLFDELALDLSGLFGRGGAIALIPMPATTLRYLVEELEKLDPDVWRDDTTLGWIYQYWNDPERESIDQKMNDGGKVEPHEIASKTQMFTERYMVEWLLQNSLNNQWLDICAANGWVAEAVSDRTLENLEARRQDWRQRREAGDVALDELMPIENEQEQRWKYWVRSSSLSEVEGTANLVRDSSEVLASTSLSQHSFPSSLSEVEGTVNEANQRNLSLRNLKLIDPACGSGHFLVIAFDLLFAFYQEEARHRGEVWTDAAIANSILENNLYGIDIDARAVQMAAAALWLKAKGFCKKAAPKQINLVAANLNLANLPKDDPELLNFYDEVEQETGIPPELTMQIVEALKGADVWGSLLKVNQAVGKAFQDREGDVLEGLVGQFWETSATLREHQAILASLEKFLNKRSGSDDLGVRLWGEQLAAGVRFVRMVREGQYDLVIGNPPYQGTSKMADAVYLSKHYPKGKADLYAAFLQRGLELAKDGGFSALLTMRNWMFISQYSAIREFLIENYDLRLLGDLETGAFEGISGQVVSVSMTIFQKLKPSDRLSIAIQPKTLQISEAPQQTPNKRAALLAQVGRYEFKTQNFNVIKEKPLIYWWDDAFLKRYAETPKIEDTSFVGQGMGTRNGIRFERNYWEVKLSDVLICPYSDITNITDLRKLKWIPFIKGAAGREWFEPLSDIVLWNLDGLEVRVWIEKYRLKSPGQYIRNEIYYFRQGVAFTPIGNRFSARLHRHAGIFSDAGSSVYGANLENITCLMNSDRSRQLLSSLNPTVNFVIGDVNRLPLFPIESADEIFSELEKAFSEHEAGRETSVEFISPRPSPWRTAQTWAQTAVDRPAGTPLPPYHPHYDLPTAQDIISYAVGLALGRFSKSSSLSEVEGTVNVARAVEDASGVLASTPLSQPSFSLPILYLSAYSQDLPEIGDSLIHPAAAPIHQAWAEHGSQITKKALREWLRQDYFKEVHVKRYDQRPIYFPISSTKKNFVAIIPIHQWTDNTLQTLLADHLLPDQNHLIGEINDLMAARSQGDSKARATAEKRYSELCKFQEELQALITKVQEIAERGALPTKPSDPPREVDATFKMDLDDGVMINSAALWTLLEPQWTKPKTWWSELSTAQNKKDYDWSHLVARYFPSRVDEKCQKDPSLAVAHRVFWKYHPAKAYEWELRLQDEIAPDFHIEEPDSQSLRDEFIKGNPELVKELEQKEKKRKERKKNKEEDQIPIDMDEDFSEE
ncbi:MAG: BREX-6 system adenine-specific DNA-methyltransferase PglX [Pseudanabaena frigida]|uniref:site-specific DNA-methyltransferase (adenine-specific) n=1 Tax=Pseudanabaena frigida TaxID=945775 RepID=A0A2W4WAP5_9CYAN|nr:MAG: BREX-6 system adenine-specific DNA-methyltransferase PglX [Pseudanabaena frigida]